MRNCAQVQHAELEDSLGTSNLFDDLLIINHLEFTFLITLCGFQVRRVCELVSDQLQNPFRESRTGERETVTGSGVDHRIIFVQLYVGLL